MRKPRLLLPSLTAAMAILVAAPALADHDGAGEGDDTGTATVTADVGALAGGRTITSVAGGAQGVSLPDPLTAVLGGDFTGGSVALVQDPLDTSKMRAALAVVVEEVLAPRINEWHVTLKSTELAFEEDPETTHTIPNSALTAGAPTTARLNALAGLSVNNGAEANLSAERLIYSVTGSANPLLLDVDLYASLQQITLDLPTSVSAGQYVGTFTVTLYE